MLPNLGYIVNILYSGQLSLCGDGQYPRLLRVILECRGGCYVVD